MRFKDFHPSQQELLLAADGELSPRRARRIEAHLKSCWKCRALRRELEDSIGEAVRAHAANFDPLPSAAGPRARLAASLRDLAAAGAETRLRSLALAGAAAAIAAVLAAGVLLQLPHWIAERRGGARDVAVSVPRANLTPGATVPATRQEVCGAEPAPDNRMIPAQLRRRVFEEYGIAGAEPRAYEVDYLITPALGGADDIRNLWPQSYSSTVWNAHVKDALEDRLHTLVCSGNLDLATAQRDIATDWIGAYKKYFHTDRPPGD